MATRGRGLGRERRLNSQAATDHRELVLDREVARRAWSNQEERRVESGRCGT